MAKMTREQKKALNAAQPWASPRMWRTDSRGRKVIDLDYHGGDLICWPSNFGQIDSFLIYMAGDKPGEYFNERGQSVPADLARKAGIPVEKHMLARRRAELQAKANAIVAKQMERVNQRVEAALAAELAETEADAQ